MYTISWYIVLVEWNKGMHLADDHDITHMPNYHMVFNYVHHQLYYVNVEVGTLWEYNNNCYYN